MISLFLFSSDPVYVHQVEVSNLVYSMLSSLKGLWDMKMSAEFVSFQPNSYFKHTLIFSFEDYVIKKQYVTITFKTVDDIL